VFVSFVSAVSSLNQSNIYVGGAHLQYVCAITVQIWNNVE